MPSSNSGFGYQEFRSFMPNWRNSFLLGSGNRRGCYNRLCRRLSSGGLGTAALVAPGICFDGLETAKAHGARRLGTQFQVGHTRARDQQGASR